MRTTTHLHTGYTDWEENYIPPGTPRGAFRDTCLDIGWDPENRILSADCTFPNGEYLGIEFSKLTVPPNYYGRISNCRGTLTLGDC
jgi:hypothetical protein